MAKAETGVAGPVVAEIAYRNEYISVRGQARFAEEAWQRGKCHSMPPSATPAVTAPAIPEWRSRPPNPRSLRARAGRSTRISLHSPKPTVANSTAQSLHNHSPPRLTGHVNRTGQIRFARSG